MMARVLRWYDYNVKACKVIFAIFVGQENMLISNMQALLRLLSYLTIVFEVLVNMKMVLMKRALSIFFDAWKAISPLRRADSDWEEVWVWQQATVAEHAVHLQDLRWWWWWWRRWGHRDQDRMVPGLLTIHQTNVCYPSFSTSSSGERAERCNSCSPCRWVIWRQGSIIKPLPTLVCSPANFNWIHQFVQRAMVSWKMDLQRGGE